MSSTLSKSLIRLHRCQNAITHKSLQASKSFTTQSNYKYKFNSNPSVACTSNPNANVSTNANANSSIHKYSPMPNFQMAQFSTTPNAEKDPSATVTATTTAAITDDATFQRSPSVLSALSQNYTPGQAWGILQKHLAGHNKVRLDDFIALCNASRPKYPKDAKVILTALLDLKRCNDFYISEEGAHAAIEGMVRSMISDSGLDATEDEFKLKAGIFIGKVFGNEGAGLYCVAGTEDLNDRVLKLLLSGAENYSPIPRDDVDMDVDVDVDLNAGTEDGENSVSASLLVQAATIAKDTVDILMTRASSPTKDMKKRKKRNYLKYSRCSSGPTPESIDLAVKICLKHDEEGEGVKMARAILDAYKACQHIGSADVDTIALVGDAESRMQAMKDAEAADEESKDDDSVDGSEAK